MELADVKKSLNKRVRVKSIRNVDGEYILAGCIIRKKEDGTVFYQCEVKDINNRHSLCIVSLADINLAEGESNE